METKMNTQKNILAVALLLAICFGLAAFLYWKKSSFKPIVPVPQTVEEEQIPLTNPRVNEFKPHPGTIILKNLDDGKEMQIPVAGIPLSDQFVYFKNDKETTDELSADQREPIIRQEFMPLTNEGAKISLDKATTLKIKEYGEKGLLRERTVDRTLEQGLGPAQTPKE
ncbi:MAG: hypothetical protein Q8P56_03590 [Candidatus Uhrbacteria bacterium]|nr:hypothetical protein [Candidatus Uhrbacteria bacterium]